MGTVWITFNTLANNWGDILHTLHTHCFYGDTSVFTSGDGPHKYISAEIPKKSVCTRKRMICTYSAREAASRGVRTFDVPTNIWNVRVLRNIALPICVCVCVCVCVCERERERKKEREKKKMYDWIKKIGRSPAHYEDIGELLASRRVVSDQFFPPNPSNATFINFLFMNENETAADTVPYEPWGPFIHVLEIKIYLQACATVNANVLRL